MESSAPIRLFSTDLDGTLLGHLGGTRRFKFNWEQLPADSRPLLVYNSGRLVPDLRRFVDDGTLPAAEYYIGGVGTEIFDVRAGQLMTEFAALLAQGWDRAAVDKFMARQPGARRQPDPFQHEFKSSWYLDHAPRDVLSRLKLQLAALGLDVQLVYSSARDLDILPTRATKGGALAWLAAQLGLATDSLLVAGDTGNDASMFLLPGVRGILVGNALPELRRAVPRFGVYRALRNCGEGVLDGLRHYGVGPSGPGR